MTLFEELNKEYEKTKFPFFIIIHLKYYTLAEAKELKDKGIIRARHGLNHILIELLKT